jgi:serralysin
MTSDVPAVSDNGTYTGPKGNLYGGPFDSTDKHIDLNTRALLINVRWTTTPDGQISPTTMTYFFPQSKTDYTVVDGYPVKYLTGFNRVTDEQESAIKTAFALVESYTPVKFVKADSGLAAAATFRFSRWNDPADQSSYAFYPSRTDTRPAGDVFLAGNGDVPANVDGKPAFFGTDGFNTIIHELGHAFGLKHGHETDPNGALDPSVNDNEFSVMTYASYIGSNTSQVTTAREGSSPQSYMMYDIAALQALYGANYSKVGSQAIYTWDAVTGQQLINNVAAPNTGVSSMKKIFTTVWTAGATATYDFSNFTEGGTLDLRPGQWSTFSRSQLADLNSEADAGTAQYLAKGNVYNALLYKGDQRSAVANVVGTGGKDTIIGNDIDNRITGGKGDDDIDGGKGVNTAAYSSASKNYAVTLFAGNSKFQVTDKVGTDG